MRRPALLPLLSTLAALLGCEASERELTPGADRTAVADTARAEPAPGFLYGRVTTYGGEHYEGRLRWGGDEEAFWTDYFNGRKSENPWAHHAPVRSTERRPVLFGIELPGGEPEVDLGRPFMARFGDVARVEAFGDGVRGVIEDGAAFEPTVRVTLKSGTAFDLDRLEASDFDDGVRVWDRERGVVDLGPSQVRSVEFLPTPALAGAPDRLYGTVRAEGGLFTGFVQWDREDATGSDLLTGQTAGGATAVRFDSVRTIAKLPGGGARVGLLGGEALELRGTRQVDDGNRGAYVDDPRYGRVLVSWDAFEQAAFVPGGDGPAYGDFPDGSALAGSVTTRDGRRLGGRLVFDLDESETTETLDAPAGGVDYTIPFGLVVSIALPEAPDEPADVVLANGERLRLERSGDLGPANAGLLVFADPEAFTDAEEAPAYVPWAEVSRVDFDPAPAETASPAY